MTNRKLFSYFPLIMFCLLLLGFNYKSDSHKFKCPFKNGTIAKINLDSINKDKNFNLRKSIEVSGSDSKVLAMANGVVKKIIAADSTFTVIIKAGVFIFSYENLDSIYVEANRKVLSGEVIGGSRSHKIELLILRNSIEISKPEGLLDCQCNNEAK